MSRFISTLLQGKQPILFEGDDTNKRDFIHIDDINDFHVLCVEDSRVDHKMFRLGTGRNHSMQEVLAMTQKVLGTSVEPIVKPRMPGDPPVQTLADISEATALGWAPKVDLEEGIRSMVPYIQSALTSGEFK